MNQLTNISVFIFVTLVTNRRRGEIEESNHYYPFGMLYGESVGSTNNRQPYKYNGKELQTAHGLNLHDYGARHYDAALGRWGAPDPLAEKYYSVSPYAYCSNNPINRIDPDGNADFWVNGKVIGNDGVDDQRILVIKTTQTSFSEGEHRVDGAGLSKKEFNATVDFIKANSGNPEAFQNNGMAYTNSIAIKSSADNRQAMVNEVSRDNGRGGTNDANNREYGGTISNGVVSIETPGSVANPSVNSEASISLPYGAGISRFHSHPSGTVVEGGTNSNTTSAVSSFGGQITTHSFNQPPSPTDVQNAGGNVNYVFGRGDNKVYVYTSAGVQAVIPMNRFVTPKR
jgi:RHS repeat-associated protein